MDRTSFFCSCSFLIPLRSTSWPPKRSCSDLISGEALNGNTATIGFVLSVELCSSCCSSHPKPLFFRETDPAMTPIQLCSCDDRKSFYLRIGSDVYLLDTRSIQNRSVVEAVYEDPENTERKATFPPCLILDMGNVNFRIFRNRLGDCSEDFASLQKMEQSLAAAQPSPRFSVQHDEVASPCRISIGSSQQNDSSSTELLLPDKKRKRCSTDEELQQRGEKRRTHFHDFRATAKRLSQVLQQPVTKPTDPSRLTPLLNRLADTAAASYILQEEVDALQNASSDHQQNSSSCSTRVQQLLDQFFPARNRRKSQLHETTPTTTTPNKKEEGDFSLERMEEALQEQERHAKAKYEILMLPRRG